VQPDAPAPLSDAVRGFLDGPHAAALATVGADGTPHQVVVWYRLEPDGRILVNSRPPRRWPAELRRTEQAALAIVDETDGQRWVGLACTLDEVVEDVDRARDDIIALAHRYRDASPEAVALYRTQPRVTFLLRIDAIHDHLGA
jgi:PPOX class probable F420-dependent enzyme